MKLPLLPVVLLLPISAMAQTASSVPSPSASANESRMALVFTGGHETVPVDRGRPVILIASALNVQPEVFREAFSNVHPAGPGHEPEPDQVRKNKQFLMEALGPYGITDDRLNQVSNYYRYNRSKGEMWRTSPASGYATVRDGAVVSVAVTNAGAGYSSVPVVSIAGMPNQSLTAVVIYGTDFATNGSVRDVKIGNPAASAK